MNWYCPSSLLQLPFFYLLALSFLQSYTFLLSYLSQSFPLSYLSQVSSGADLNVKENEPGDENGLGKVVALYTKGWLPYTIRWTFRVTEVNYPYGFALEAWGDLVGRGLWALRQEGEWVDIIYDWKINAEKPLFRIFSFILKPVFTANHLWAMRMGEESLKLELLRRRAKTSEERTRIPMPPGHTFKSFIQQSV